MKLESAVLDRYVGAYEARFNGQPVRTRIWREGDHLYAQTDGQEKSELLPLNNTEFFDAGEPEEGGAVYVFKANGAATMEWIYRDGAVEVRSKRMSTEVAGRGEHQPAALRLHRHAHRPRQADSGDRPGSLSSKCAPPRVELSMRMLPPYRATVS